MAPVCLNIGHHETQLLRPANFRFFSIGTVPLNRTTLSFPSGTVGTTTGDTATTSVRIIVGQRPVFRHSPDFGTLFLLLLCREEKRVKKSPLPSAVRFFLCFGTCFVILHSRLRCWPYFPRRPLFRLVPLQALPRTRDVPPSVTNRSLPFAIRPARFGAAFRSKADSVTAVRGNVLSKQRISAS